MSVLASKPYSILSWRSRHPIRAGSSFLSKAFPWTVSVFILGLTALDANATVISQNTIEEMVVKADVVVHARVVDQQVKEDGARILTLTQIEIIDGLKGAAKGDLLTIYQVGGTVNGKTQRILGTHQHAVHEEMLLFAMKYRDGLVSFGVGAGKFLVLRETNTARVIEDVQDVAVLRSGQNGRNEIVDAEPRELESLPALKRQIRDILSKPRIQKEQRKLRILPAHQRVLPMNRKMGGE
jgi:hypothetical protein